MAGRVHEYWTKVKQNGPQDIVREVGDQTTGGYWIFCELNFPEIGSVRWLIGVGWWGLLSSGLAVTNKDDDGYSNKGLL